MAWKLEVLCLVYLKALIAYSILKESMKSIYYPLMQIDKQNKARSSTMVAMFS